MTACHETRSVAIIGGGRMGFQHFAACRRLGRAVRVVAVIDPDPDVRRRYAGLGAPVCAALEHVDLRKLDLVIVAAPTAAHLTLLDTLSAHPVRVLVEKPCALDAAGFERLQRIAPRFRRLGVGLWRRFSPPFVALRDLIRCGSLGTPRLALACQLDASPPPLTRAPAAATGGIGLDCGVHETDTARWLGLGDPDRLVASVPSAFPDWVTAGDSDQLVATGRTTRDVLLSVVLTRTAGGIDRIQWKVVCSGGSAEVELGASGLLRVLTEDGRRREEAYPGDPISIALDRQLRAALGLESAAGALADDVRRAAQPWIAPRRAGHGR